MVKVIFLIDSTFSERDFIRFGLKILLRNNFQVSLWDFSFLRVNQIDNTGFENNIDSKIVNRYVFKDFKELNEKINELDKAFLIDQRSALYKKHNTCWFKEYGAIIVKFEQGLIPLVGWRPSISDYLIILRNNILNDGPIKTISKVFSYVNNNFININKECYDIKVCSGKASKCNNDAFEIRSHSFDYDIYLEKKNKKKNPDEYIVFLDNGMVEHPDYIKLGISPYCTEAIYYPLLRSFFRTIEEKTGMSVKVAVHPRLIINEQMNDNFGGRELISGRTAELVKDAKLVLAHDSTSINFAALWRIPLIIITTDQIERSIYPFMQALTQILQTSRINLNSSYNNLDFFEIAQKPLSQYNQFVEKIIKDSSSPQKNSAEILIKGLRNYVQ